jgi:Domain of unknown function (DUF5655)
MAINEAVEEQQFLAELKARSGRNLADWMAAITAQNFGDKNETIDWLRGQGFAFARASWLERIHSNGGRPIYEAMPDRGQRAKPAALREPRSEAPLPPAPDPSAAPASSPAPASSSPAPADAALLAKLIAAGKGYRPLYLMLEEAVRGAVPALALSPRSTHISWGAPHEFAAVTLNASEVRLGLALGERPFDATLQRSRLKGPGANITHMLVLTDARQVNADLMSLISGANTRVNG